MLAYEKNHAEISSFENNEESSTLSKCSSLVSEIVETACKDKGDIHDVSEDEIEFVNGMKRQSAWDSLTPTPQLSTPRPPACYGGMGEFMKHFRQVLVENTNDSSNIGFSLNHSTYKENEQRPAFTIGHTHEESAHELGHADQDQSKSYDEPVAADQSKGSTVSKPKYTCIECGTQFSKELVLKFHMAVHKY